MIVDFFVLNCPFPFSSLGVYFLSNFSVTYKPYLMLFLHIEKNFRLPMSPDNFDHLIKTGFPELGRTIFYVIVGVDALKAGPV